MGFLKFLRRDKGKEHDFSNENLDMPPIHPYSKEDGGKELLGFPETPREETMEIKEKAIPELQATSTHEFSKIEEDETKTKLSEPVHDSGMKSYETFEIAGIGEEPYSLGHKDLDSPIFVSIDDFRGVISSTSTIKKDLKITDHSIIKLSEIELARDKILANWHNVMTDLQKKLVFIDKTLFKR